MLQPSVLSKVPSPLSMLGFQTQSKLMGQVSSRAGQMRSMCSQGVPLDCLAADLRWAKSHDCYLRAARELLQRFESLAFVGSHVSLHNTEMSPHRPCLRCARFRISPLAFVRVTFREPEGSAEHIWGDFFLNFGVASFRKIAGESLSEFWWRIFFRDFSALFFWGCRPPHKIHAQTLSASSAISHFLEPKIYSRWVSPYGGDQHSFPRGTAECLR